MYKLLFNNATVEQFSSMVKAKRKFVENKSAVICVIFPDGDLVFPFNEEVSTPKALRAWKKRGCKEKQVAPPTHEQYIVKQLEELYNNDGKGLVKHGLCYYVCDKISGNRLANWNETGKFISKTIKEICKNHELISCYTGKRWDGYGYISRDGEWTPERKKLCKLLIEHLS